MAIAYVNSNSGYSGGPITLNGVTAGNLLVAMISGNSALTTTSLPAGWTKLTPVDDSAGTCACMWYYQNHGGGNVSATITNAPSDPGWSIHEYSGASTTTAYVGEGSFSSGGTSWDTGDVTTDVASSVLVIMEASETADLTYTETGTWNLRTSQNSHYHYTLDQIVSSTGTYDSKGSVNTGANFIVVLAVFEAGAAPAGRTTKNTRSFPLGIAAGMNRRM